MSALISPVDYVHKVKPFEHQDNAFKRYRDEDCGALLHEQGTGKTKTLIDIAAWKYMQGTINALVVLAPNGVHVNWIKNEMPAHLPDHINHVSAWWRSTPKAAERKAIEALTDTTKDGLRILTMNVEAVSKTGGKAQKYLKDFLIYFNCMVVLDESHRFATPGANRTKFILRSGQHAVTKFIATGTSMSTGPLNLYTQYKFLDPEILGYSTYTAFKNDFAVWERRTVNNTRGHYDHLVGYQNLDKLAGLIKPYTDRVLKKDCLDLPEKLRKKILVELAPKQRAMYNKMLAESIVALRDAYRQQTGVAAPSDPDPENEILFFLTNENVPSVIAKNAAVRTGKLKQISSGFIIDDDKAVHIIDGPNPKLAALLDSIQDYPGKIIIWAWYREEMRLLIDTLRAEYGDEAVVHYYGGTTADEREVAKHRFQNDESCRFFVGQPRSGGIGLTLTASCVTMYFSRVPYEARYQSEDRNHRIGQTENVLYVDFVAQDTVEEKADEAMQVQAAIIDSVYKLLED